MLCQMVSDSKRNPDHIISFSIFLQRGQFIEFHIRFTYDIFLPKKKLSAKISSMSVRKFDSHKSKLCILSDSKYKCHFLDTQANIHVHITVSCVTRFQL